MQFFIVTAAGLVLATYYITRHIIKRNGSTLEPPVVTSSIPFIGHAIGLMREKADYYVQLHRRTGLSIFSLNIGTQNMYIVNSPHLIKLIQKQPKAFDFHPIVAYFTKNVCYLSKEASAIVDFNVDGELGDRSAVISFHKIMTPTLAPGPDLDRMNRTMIENIAKSLEQLEQVANRTKTIMLSHWIRHEVTMATTNAIYGPLNPFLDPTVEKAFWDFTDDLGPLLLNFLPNLTAPKAHKGRKIVADAFYEYFSRNGHENGSALIQSRYEHGADYKMPLSDIARLEVGGAIAVLLNTTPSVFWMLYSIYSEPDLLRDCRKELDAIVVITNRLKGQSRRVVDITDVKTNCPLLTSIFAETLRCRGIALGVRRVMQDTMLDGNYLLKKDRIVMMPAKVLHSDPSLWGIDVQDFQPRRFMKNHDHAKHDPVAFRGFGGGLTLCPGRHFATAEIFATVVMILLRYDINPHDGWKQPTTHKTSIASSVMEPDADIEVQVTFRPGFESGEWAFGLKDSEMVFAVAAEDRA